jgi:hypothetical protein
MDNILILGIVGKRARLKNKRTICSFIMWVYFYPTEDKETVRNYVTNMYI